MRKGDLTKSSRVRDQCAEALEFMIAELRGLFYTEETNISQKIQIAQMMAKYGLPDVKTLLIEKDEWMDVVSRGTENFLEDDAKFDEWTKTMSRLMNGLK